MDKYGIIYKWTNLVNKKVYIGQTTISLKIRTEQHLYDAFHHRTNMILHSAIKKYGFSNFSVEEIATGRSKEELDSLEQEYIKRYDCCILDGREKGYNMTRGGDSGEHRGKEVCKFDLEGNYLQSFQTIAEAAKNVGTSRSAITQACQNIYKTAGKYQWCYKEDFDLKNGQKVVPAKKTNKPVIQYNLQGELIKVWNSATEAAKAGKGIRQHIYKVCKGERNQTGGYIWRYCYEEDNIPKRSSLTFGRKIVQIDKDTNEIVNYFNTISEAERNLNIKQGKSHISDVCKGKRSIAYGYKWRYND